MLFSLLFNLLAAGSGLLGNSQNSHKDEEYNSLGLSHTVIILTDVIGGVDVESQKFGA